MSAAAPCLLLQFAVRRTCNSLRAALVYAVAHILLRVFQGIEQGKGAGSARVTSVFRALDLPVIMALWPSIFIIHTLTIGGGRAGKNPYERLVASKHHVHQPLNMRFWNDVTRKQSRSRIGVDRKEISRCCNAHLQHQYDQRRGHMMPPAFQQGFCYSKFAWDGLTLGSGPHAQNARRLISNDPVCSSYVSSR